MKIFFLTLMLLATSAFAKSSLEFSNAKIRLNPPGTTTTAMFVTIKNNSSKNIKVLKVESDISNDIELHNMIMENNSMKMRTVNDIEVKANSTTELKPGSLHVMIFKLKKVLKDKEEVSFKFNTDNKESVLVKAVVDSEI